MGIPPSYISIDIESTGLDADVHQILEFAAVLWVNDGPVEDQPYVNFVVDPRIEGEKYIVGDPYALQMNHRLITKIVEGEGRAISFVMSRLKQLLHTYGISPENPIAIIGQNFGKMDFQFLRRVEDWPANYFSHRFFDVSTIAATRDGMQSAANILDIPDIEGDKHEALYDARVALHWVREYFDRMEAL